MLVGVVGLEHCPYYLMGDDAEEVVDFGKKGSGVCNKVMICSRLLFDVEGPADDADV